MRRGRVVIWAVVTFALGWGLFAFIMPIFNRAKSSGTLAHAYAYLVIPLAAQIVWLVGAVIICGPRNRRETAIGILSGFGLEFAALMILMIIIAAFSRY